MAELPDDTNAAQADAAPTGEAQADAEFSREYSEEGFWQKLKGYARTAGTEVVEKALILFYVLQEDKAPAWAKAAIVGALGYFITFIDAIPDITPAVGYADDLGVLVMAIAAVSTYVNDDVRRKAQAKLHDWFGEDPP
ncbi:MAG: YkvA family protein [Congregibacter sp.]